MVPCHRVVGSDGSLHGYAYGLSRKRQLLDAEAGVGAAETKPNPSDPGAGPVETQPRLADIERPVELEGLGG